MEAFEGTKDVMKLVKEKVKRIGKKAIKEAKKIAGVHVGPTTEANPSYYLVVASQGATVRKDILFDSPIIGNLSHGDLITCVEISGRRAKIVEPIQGWVSLRTDSNESVLLETIAPDKSIQKLQMERRFRQLKAAKDQHDDETVIAPSGVTVSNVSHQPVKESDIIGIETLKEMLTFKKPCNSDVSCDSGAIPRLSLPSMKKPLPSSRKDLGATVDDLLGFETNYEQPSEVAFRPPQSDNLFDLLGEVMPSYIAGKQNVPTIDPFMEQIWS